MTSKLGSSALGHKLKLTREEPKQRWRQTLIFPDLCLSQGTCVSNLRMLNMWSVTIRIVFPYTCEHANTILIRPVWARIFSNTEEKKFRFRKYPDTCGRGLIQSYSVDSR